MRGLSLCITKGFILVQSQHGTYEFFVTCAQGLEHVLGDELRGLGIKKPRPLTGGVSFHGGLQEAYTALLWSRVASRVLCVLARVDAADSDELYRGVRTILWEEHIGSGSTIAVSARGTSETLRDTRFTGLRVKDAICDYLREQTGERPNVDTAAPDILVQVSLRGKRATVSIDLSGGSLESRGYEQAHRGFRGEMRETLAAAMLLQAGWPSACRAGEILVDPACMTATLAIEAALIACDIAPGITREHWGFSSWLHHDDELWGRILDEADQRAQDARRRTCVYAAESRDDAYECAVMRAKRAGVGECIDFERSQKTLFEKTEKGSDPILFACNLMTSADVVPASMPAFYAALGASVQKLGRVDRCALLSDDTDLTSILGYEELSSIATRSGNEPCSIYVYKCTYEHTMQNNVVVRGQEIAVHDKGAQQFADRLNKVFKQRKKWAQQNKVYAYRVYDADLPDYNMAIDVYRGAAKDEGKTLVHVAEYAPPKQIDPAKAARRMTDALNIVCAVFELPMNNVFVKRRKRAKGGSQYAKAETQGSRAETSNSGKLTTCENGLLFEVDLASYLDTGLFLDHRDTRALVARFAKGKSFLNLFAYTGTASVYAAAGGAKFTTTVDLSNTYLQWGQRNMELNGLMNGHQEFERADCIAWIQQTRHTKMRWDLIFVDPPTFSNSAKMGKRSWDVQRDHAELLIGASRLLTRTGTMMFSCNLRGFKPDVEALAKAGVAIVDITDRTIPQDFERNLQVHHCYLLRRR